MFTLAEPTIKPSGFYLEYLTFHTDAYERDMGFENPLLFVSSVSNLDQLADFYRCFKFVEDIVMKIGRVGNGLQGEYLPFERIVEEDEDQESGVGQVEWDSGVGVLFTMKDGTEHFVHVSNDIGMPTEDGNFLEGLQFINFTYVDEQGNEFLVAIK